jgi:hypothetical protein
VKNNPITGVGSGDISPAAGAGSAQHITPGLSNFSITAELPAVSTNALIYSSVRLNQTPDTLEVAIHV